MTIQEEAKRVKAGQSLTDFQNQAISAVAQLEGIKTNLLNLKTTVEGDADFTTDDVSEIDAIITDLATRIQAILA